MNYAHAWECKNCPESNGAKGCPAWWEYSGQDTVTSEIKIIKTCGLQGLLSSYAHVIAASNRPAASIDRMRQEVAAGLNEIAKEGLLRFEVPQAGPKLVEDTRGD